MEAGSVECVEVLAGEEGVEWNEKNLVGKTPLLTAMRENNTDMVKTLLKIPSVDINVKDRHGKCLLKLAAEKNNLQLVKIFEQILPEEEPISYLPELFKEECEWFVVDIEKGPGKKEIGIKWTGGVNNPPGNKDGVTVEEVWGQAADCGIQKDDQIVPINGQWTIGGRSSLWSRSRFNECSRQYSYVGNQERCAQKQVSSANRGSSACSI